MGKWKVIVKKSKAAGVDKQIKNIQSPGVAAAFLHKACLFHFWYCLSEIIIMSTSRSRTTLS